MTILQACAALSLLLFVTFVLSRLGGRTDYSWPVGILVSLFPFGLGLVFGGWE